MRALWVLLPAAALGAGWLLGARGEVAPPPRPPRSEVPVEAARTVAPPPAPSIPAPIRPERPPRIDVRERLTGDLAKSEEELAARLLEDRAFAEELFDAFRAETDPVRMSFLANVLASDPRVRNAAAWQERFMKVAEGDPSFERRAASLIFLQEAETIRPVADRMLALAENDRELCAHALAALKGLPDRRAADPRVGALAGRIADREPDPTLRGIALRVEADPSHAARYLSDSDRTVRIQASRVATSRAALSAALEAEQDLEVREMLQLRLDELK